MNNTSYPKNRYFHICALHCGHWHNAEKSSYPGNTTPKDYWLAHWKYRHPDQAIDGDLFQYEFHSSPNPLTPHTSPSVSPTPEVTAEAINVVVGLMRDSRSERVKILAAQVIIDAYAKGISNGP